jgi:hypothetical protein
MAELTSGVVKPLISLSEQVPVRAQARVLGWSLVEPLGPVRLGTVCKTPPVAHSAPKRLTWPHERLERGWSCGVSVRF